MIHSASKNKKAFSLIEVIIVLAVISMTMISSMTVVLRANAMIKNNEIRDTANDILLQAFELLRSPDAVKVYRSTGFQPLSLVDVTTSYSMEFQDTASTRGYLNRETSMVTDRCEALTVYVAETIGQTRPYPICLKIDITPKTAATGVINRYNISLTLFYNLSSGYIKEVYSLSRFESFVQIY